MKEQSRSIGTADSAAHHRPLWALGWTGTVVVLAIACVLAAVAVGQAGTVFGKLAGERATAVVTAYREQRSRGGSTSYFPVFRFSARSGEVVEVASRAGWGWKGPEVGQNVTVAYPATRPSEAEIIGLGMFMNSLIFGLFAFPLLLLGLVSARASLRRMRNLKNATG